jgi:hypothetical protein
LDSAAKVAPHQPGIAQPISVSEAARDLQIDFARHNFEHQQSLIRAADAKAGAFTTLLLFLCAISVPLGTVAISKLHWSGPGWYLTIAYLASYALFGFGVVRSLDLMVHVVKPRGISRNRAKRLDAAEPSPAQAHFLGTKLLFHEHVLLHKDRNTYYHAVCAASADTLLRNLTDEVFELSRICDEKLLDLNESKTPLLIAVYGWAATIAVGIWLVHR